MTSKYYRIKKIASSYNRSNLFAFLPLLASYFEGCNKSGPDGRWLGKNQQPEPLIIDPGTSPQEALLLLKIHRDGMSVVLPAED
jgi:hypothetical protein